MISILKTNSEERGRLVDGTAKAGGILTTLITWLSGWNVTGHLAPSALVGAADVDVLVKILVAVIGGCFGLASTAVAVLLKHWLETRRKRKDEC